MLLICELDNRVPEGPDVIAESAPLTLAADVEKRRGLRIIQQRPVKVFEPTTCRYFGGQTRDISATGLRIEMAASAVLRPGKLLNIHIGTSDEGEPLANRRQMVPARVVWMDRHIGGDGAILTAGIEFVSSVVAHLDAA